MLLCEAMTRRALFLLFAIGTLALAGVLACARGRGGTDWVEVHEITPEFLARAEGGDPALATDLQGRVALTWVTREEKGEGRNLWLAVSRDSGATFAAPVRVNLRAGRVDSYPESRPLPALGPGSALAVAWSERRDSTAAVDLLVRASGDAGGTLEMPVVVNDDRTTGKQPLRRRAGMRSPPPLDPRAFHGFPALAYLPDGSLFAAWLDGRHSTTKDEEGEMAYASLYSALSPDGGQSFGANVRVADSVCSCCRPSAASDAAGRIAVLYRAAAGDLRDHALAVSSDRGASFPLDTVLSADRWKLSGCPADGPALAWDRSGAGTVAWYTGVDPAGVYVLPWSPDRGAMGMKRALSDAPERSRHPRLAAAGDVTWIAVEARDGADTKRPVMAVRALGADARLTPWVTLGAGVRTGAIAALGAHGALVCWVEEQDGRRRIRLARLQKRT